MYYSFLLKTRRTFENTSLQYGKHIKNVTRQVRVLMFAIKLAPVIWRKGIRRICAMKGPSLSLLNALLKTQS